MGKRVQENLTVTTAHCEDEKPDFAGGPFSWASLRDTSIPQLQAPYS